ncbi:phosphatase PAP2 family protein [Paenibacillus sp. URB8-2]|uniref:phosphatase PAP2 family protein n=1 Tax=Paenibacillus sp. URB8-2 TaxID=2741301 RepID=UPI0015C24BE0|nr:phosphatase PAP2 family protein [Paenibacillus sp. URB8-2]BCG59010.1 phosphatase PAP2 family protein [Paenibacillus sp. URB8-2]
MTARHWSRGFRLFLLFVVIFGLIAVLVTYNHTAWFDDRIIHLVQSPESPALTSTAKTLSLVGSSKIVISLSLVIMAALFLFLKHRLELLLFLWVGVTSNILNSILKNWIHRERPNIHRIIEETGFSFPSGHSMAAFSVYGALTFLLWRHLRSGSARVLLVVICFILTAAIGWSRIYLGVHYPSDVIGGYAASCAWLMLSIVLFEALRSFLKKRKG